MNLTQEKALFQLTGKLQLSQVSGDSLVQLAKEAPYFAPARFFLAARTKQHSSDNVFINEAKKANLYFTNPYWFQYQLDAIEVLSHNPKTFEVQTPQQQTAKAVDFAVPTVEAVKELMRKIDPAQEDSLSEDEDELLPDGYEEESKSLTQPGETESKIAGILSGQLADFKKPVEADATLDFDAEKERLHTIDYFASQGIKIDLSSIPQDKLTTHLRKFTDWLKQMKQVNGSTSDLGTNLEMEKAVAENAKNSNETREIMTETMAEVLVQQGQTEKAIQLYIKLSFLNPEKSSYFAAKIEQLKGI